MVALNPGEYQEYHIDDLKEAEKLLNDMDDQGS